MKKSWFISVFAIILVATTLSVSFSTHKNTPLTLVKKDTLILLPDVNDEFRTCCYAIHSIRNRYYRDYGIQEANKKYLGCMTRCYGKRAADSLLKIILENEKTGRDTIDDYFWKIRITDFNSAVKASHDYLYWKPKKCGVRLADSAFQAMISKAKDKKIITSAQYDSIVTMSAKHIKNPIKLY